MNFVGIEMGKNEIICSFFSIFILFLIIINIIL